MANGIEGITFEDLNFETNTNGNSTSSSQENKIIAIELTKNNLVLEKGKSTQIRANIIDTYGTDSGGVTYVESDPNIVTIVSIRATNNPTSTILSIRGAKNGSTNITVFSRTDPSVSAVLKVTVGHEEDVTPEPVDPDPIEPDPVDPDPIDPGDGPTPDAPDDPSEQDGVDYITYIKRNGESYTIEKQFSGDLNFKTGGFFDSIVDYETENVTKVYWVDGTNQPRMIILQKDWNDYDNTSFDFVPEIDKFPKVFIEKEHTNGTNIFKSGIVQYFFTYSNIHGIETAVVYSSPLFYADHVKRAGAPDDYVSCQFNISISNISQKFDKINIYRAIRTSENTEVEVVKIANIDITSSTSSIIDNYMDGQAVAPTDLFFKGGDRFIAGTLATKDNTLFLGNIKTVVPSYDELNAILKNISTRGFASSSVSQELEFVDSNAFLNGNREVTYTSKTINGQTFHSSNSYLKKGDYYHIGIQLQDKYGKWSEPIVINSYLSPNSMPNGISIPKQHIIINRSALSNQIKEKYKRVRAVICYPDDNKRIFVAQGVLNPTIYDTKDRYNNKPFAESSWFFRSIPPVDKEDVQTPDSQLLEYRHDFILGTNNQLNGEAQFLYPYGRYDSISHVFSRAYTTRVSSRTSEYNTDVLKRHLLAVDASVCTLNSPDITDIGSEEEKLNVDIVGYFSTDRTVGQYDISMVTAANLSTPTNDSITSENRVKALRNAPLTAWPLYFDSIAYFNGGIKKFTNNTGVAWAVYPWQADRPLSNDFDDGTWSGSWLPDEIVRNGEDPKYNGQYSRKRLGNIRYSENSRYYSQAYRIEDISAVSFYRGVASPLVRLANDTDSDVVEDTKNYYAGLDEIFPVDITDKSLLPWLYYSNGTTTTTDTKDDAKSFNSFMQSDIRSFCQRSNNEISLLMDAMYMLEPTIIRYRSTPHAIFKINPQYDETALAYNERVLPGYLNSNQNYYTLLRSLWYDNHYNVISSVPSLTEYREETEKDKYWIGEFTRDTAPSLMFPKDLNDQAFLPSSDILDFTGDSIDLELYGDIHYQRWDCLKTYPYSYDDKNQVIDVLSFMVESKLNLAGRYDKYVETEDVTSIDDSFFNKFNDVYNQKDNFFTYRIQEDWVKENTSFPNQFAWSQTKHPGEEIDLWTSINLASVYQTDGTLGEIRKIIKFGDNLFCFQDKGISQIMFNSNIQLSSASGVPIELANSGKIDGVRYFTNVEGCKNPWTIKAGINGVYFFDDINHSIDRINNTNFDRLSETKGFSDFAHNNNISKTWFDNEKKDVHFVTNGMTLAFSEKLDEFTSFYDYGKANIGFSVGDHFNHFFSDENKLFTARKGRYFYFFDQTNPFKFSVTYRISPQPYDYKIFNTIDYLLRVSSQRGLNHDLVYNTGFHEIEVSSENGYAKQKIDKNDFIANMNQIKKFNIWRTNIPRFDFFRRADGTSLYLSLIAGPDENGNAYQDDLADKRYELHNLKVSYLS